MRVKKYILFPLCICLLLCLTVSAHPGRTDSSGGHTDHSTGEYHYHHGYEAHSHYDMDGDGDLDCPYDFDDQTGTDSSNSSTGNSGTYSYPGDDNVIIRTETVTKTVAKEVPYIPRWIYWIIAVLAGTALILLFIIKNKCNEINSLEWQLQQEKSETKTGIIMLHNALVQQYGQDYLYNISGAPPGAIVDTNLLPHDTNYLIKPHCDTYTFFLGSSPYNYNAKYHKRSCRYAKLSTPINAHSLRKSSHYKPCMLCQCNLPDTAWVEEYSKLYSFLKKYVDLQTSRQQNVENYCGNVYSKLQQTQTKTEIYDRLLKVLKIGAGAENVDSAIAMFSNFYLNKRIAIPGELYCDVAHLSKQEQCENLLKILELGIGVTGIENVTRRLIDFYKANGIDFPDDSL